MRERRRTTLLYLTVIAGSGTLVFPIYWMLVTAITDAGAIRSYPPVFFPAEPTLAAFKAVLVDRPMLAWIKNSALVAVGSTGLSMVVSVLAGYSLSRYRSRTAEAVGLSILVSKMIPTTLLVIPLFVVFKKLGLIADLSSAALAHCTVTIPFATWMLKGYFDSIPRELEEAAMVDGCAALAALWRVILSWNEFVFSRTLLVSEPDSWTVTVGIASIKGEYIISWNEVMAASAIAALPIILVFLWLERYLVAGLTAGAQR
jgi:multiple sugar transport system permease protein